VKTTIELPDAVLRNVRVLAAARGTTLKRLFTEALEKKLRSAQRQPAKDGGDPPWMEVFGELSDLSEETERLQRIMENEFERVEPEDVG